MEECAELQKCCAKALRFGSRGKETINSLTNASWIAEEATDVLALIEMLEEAGMIPGDRTGGDLERKKDRVRLFMQRARAQGTLES